MNRMSRWRFAIPFLLLPALPSQAATDPGTDRAPASLTALIQCEAEPEQFMALATAVQDPLHAVSLGWRPLPQANAFMAEYALNTPIDVLGHATAHIAFAGSSIMAILDLPDPRPLARELELETGIDTPEKVLFGREVLSQDVQDPETGEWWIRSAILNVSNVTSHPGKTLVGCTYSIDPLEEEETGATAPSG